MGFFDLFKRERKRKNIVDKTSLSEDTVRIIKISKEALFEFIYEKMVENQEIFLDVDPLSVANSFDLDWENGQFIFCAYKSEDENGNSICLPKEIDLQKIMRMLPDTTASMYQENRYKEYTKDELTALSNKSVKHDV